jgi:hypothetical protein
VPNETPLRDAIAKIDKLPENEVNIGVIAENGDVGGSIEGQKDIGKPGGWTVAASAKWLKKAGYSAAALLKWKGKR